MHFNNQLVNHHVYTTYKAVFDKYPTYEGTLRKPFNEKYLAPSSLNFYLALVQLVGELINPLLR